MSLQFYYELSFFLFDVTFDINHKSSHRLTNFYVILTLMRNKHFLMKYLSKKCNY